MPINSPELVSLKLVVDDQETVVKLENNSVALEKLISDYNLSEEAIKKLVKGLQDEKAALAIGSEAYKEKSALLQNFNTALTSAKGTQVQVAGSTGQMTNAIGQLGWVLGDADMFLVNFGMGMRSIGNNIPMVVNGLMYANTAAKESGETFGQVLAKSLAGPGGVMLAVNGAMLAIQVLTKVMSNSAEEAKKTADAYKDAANSVIEYKNAAGEQKVKQDKEALGGYDKMKEEVVNKALQYIPETYSISAGWNRPSLAKSYSIEERRRMARQELESGKAHFIVAQNLFTEWTQINTSQQDLADKVHAAELRQRATDIARDAGAQQSLYDALEQKSKSLDIQIKAVTGHDKASLDKIKKLKDDKKKVDDEIKSIFGDDKEGNIDREGLSLAALERVIKADDMDPQEALKKLVDFQTKVNDAALSEFAGKTLKKQKEERAKLRDQIKIDIKKITQDIQDIDTDTRGKQIDAMPEGREKDMAKASLDADKEARDAARKIHNETQLLARLAAINEAYYERINELKNKWDKKDEADDKKKTDYAAKKAHDEKAFEIQRQRDDAELIENKYAKQVKIAQATTAKEIADEKYKLDRKEITQAQFDARKTALEQKLKNTEVDIAKMAEQEKLSVISSSLGKGAALFGKQTVAYKLLASAQAAIDTYKAANVALAAYPPPFNYIAMGATIAEGLANVIQINATKVPGYAQGGYIDRPTIALVGEAGPEIVAPRDQFVRHTAMLAAEATNRMTVINNNNQGSISEDIAAGFSESLKKTGFRLKRRDIYLSFNEGLKDMNDRRV